MTQSIIEKIKALTTTNLNSEVTQDKLCLWFGSMPESNGNKNWSVVIYNPKISKNPSDGFIIYHSESFGIAQFCADTVLHFFGYTEKAPKAWDYEGSQTEAPADFDQSKYEVEIKDGYKLVLHLRPYPEEFRENWSIHLGNQKTPSQRRLCIEKTEFVDRARFYYDEFMYMIGERKEEPDLEDYDHNLQHIVTTGEIFSSPEIRKKPNE